MPVEDRYTASAIGHEVPSEAARLQVMSRFLDPLTFRTLEKLAVAPGWACLDVGSGNGSVAEWLARKVPEGSVLATDVDIRHLRGDVPRLTPFVHDVVSEDFAPASFDLIHIRMLLMHLRRPEEVVRKLLRWLKPGGHLVVGGFDLSVGAASPRPVVARVIEALQRLLREDIGTDLRAERLAPGWLLEGGLVDVHAGYHVAVCGTGRLGTAFLRATLEQLQAAIVAKGACREQDFADLSAWLDEPGSVEVYGVVPMIRGRRPEASAGCGSGTKPKI